MTEDLELRVMAQIIDALTPLEADARARVLVWAGQRFGVKAAATSSPKHGGVAPATEAPTEKPEFEHFHDLFERANPTSGVDRVLLAGYWFQIKQKQADFDSATLNRELKNLGHPSTNITRDLDVLIERQPKHALQVRKDGKSAQARKRYKLTIEGIKAAERLLRNDAADADAD